MAAFRAIVTLKELLHSDTFRFAALVRGSSLERVHAAAILMAGRAGHRKNMMSFGN